MGYTCMSVTQRLIIIIIIIIVTNVTNVMIII